MANEMTYEYETVEAGAVVDTETGTYTDNSPNNTLMEIANKHSVDYTILMALNPHLLSTGIVRGRTVFFTNYNAQGELRTYTVPYVHEQTLVSITNTTTFQNTYGYHSPDSIINLTDKKGVKVNYTNFAENICFAAGQKVLRKVGSMTDSVDSFVTETYTSESTSVDNTLIKIAGLKNIELDTLMKLNPNIGQHDVLKKGTIVLLSVKSKSDGSTVTITEFGVQPDTTRTLFVTWEWDTKNNKTASYEVKWEWQSSDGRWTTGSNSTVTAETVEEGLDTKEATYTVDEKAIAARVTIRPVASGGIFTTTKYAWSTAKVHNFNYDLSMLVPKIDKVEIDKYTLTASAIIDTSTLKKETDPNGNVTLLEKVQVIFEITQDHSVVYNVSGLLDLINIDGTISYSCPVVGGHAYSVRARTLRNDSLYSSWTGYSGPYNSAPVVPNNFTVEVVSETQIKMKWQKVNSAEVYNVEYVKKDDVKYTNYTEEQYFTTSDVQRKSIDPEKDITELGDDYVSFDIPDLESGKEYYIRMNAANTDAISDWTSILTFILGKASIEPTTWSSTTTAVIGEPLKLYWIHNSEDGSIESSAKLRMIINDDENNPVEKTIVKSTDPDERYDTSSFEIDTNEYPEGSKISWQVKTAGVLTDDNGAVYGPYSASRVVNVYAPPTVQLNVTKTSGEVIDDASYPLTAYPFHIVLKAGNAVNQKPIGYYVNITTVDSYESTNSVGNTVWVSAGTKVYSKYIDSNLSTYDLEVLASDVSLENNHTYIVSAVVAMSSGLTSEVSMCRIKTAWNVVEALPFAEIKIDKETVTAQIMPYSNGTGDIVLSVYRREYDGSFTKIEPDVINGNYTVITDPHPSLDYARYRVVAKNRTTGASSHNDIPAIRVNEKAVIIQWDETYQPFDVSEDMEYSEPTYAGSMLKLPYNIDVNNSYSQDISHVRYIGRKRPVSYYGTQLGETAIWNVEIPKNDKDTLYAIRRLAVWMGDVYVREPSGSGYWASISISFSQTHCNLTIPITINITPVEGGA